ncbi:MAG: glycosyltransferase family 2 protein [Pyrinomonadaceae bacterium]|nr:glycosyltransferase family 2 protein [Pyrinomonadaceae bacterium]
MASSKFKISVALCTYNGARYLAAQLDSIAAQHRLPDEVVICDDRSDDGTVEISKRFARHAPFRVRSHFNERTLGSTKNFEKAVDLCEGDIITFCDQDDVWREDKLAQVEAVFSVSPRAGAVFSDAELVNENLEPLGYSLWQAINFSRARQKRFVGDRSVEAILKCLSLSHGMVMAFRAVYKTAILPFPARFGHDNWTASIIAVMSDLAFIQQPLVKYRQHTSQQVGFPTRSHWKGKLTSVQATAPASYLTQVDLFTSACRRVEDLGMAELHREKLALLQAKARHMLLRANIPMRRRWQRWPVVLKELAGFRYHRYSNGVLSAAKDLVLQ